MITVKALPMPKGKVTSKMVPSQFPWAKSKATPYGQGIHSDTGRDTQAIGGDAETDGAEEGEAREADPETEVVSGEAEAHWAENYESEHDEADYDTDTDTDTDAADYDEEIEAEKMAEKMREWRKIYITRKAKENGAMAKECAKAGADADETVIEAGYDETLTKAEYTTGAAEPGDEIQPVPKKRPITLKAKRMPAPKYNPQEPPAFSYEPDYEPDYEDKLRTIQEILDKPPEEREEIQALAEAAWQRTLAKAEADGTIRIRSGLRLPVCTVRLQAAAHTPTHPLASSSSSDTWPGQHDPRYGVIRKATPRQPNEPPPDRLIDRSRLAMKMLPLCDAPANAGEEGHAEQGNVVQGKGDAKGGGKGYAEVKLEQQESPRPMPKKRPRIIRELLAMPVGRGMPEPSAPVPVQPYRSRPSTVPPLALRTRSLSGRHSPSSRSPYRNPSSVSTRNSSEIQCTSS